MLITHSLANAEKADAVIVMEQGEIAEKGTHAELMEKNGLYARMYREQAELENYGKDGDEAAVTAFWRFWDIKCRCICPGCLSV